MLNMPVVILTRAKGVRYAIRCGFRQLMKRGKSQGRDDSSRSVPHCCSERVSCVIVSCEGSVNPPASAGIKSNTHSQSWGRGSIGRMAGKCGFKPLFEATDF